MNAVNTELFEMLAEHGVLSNWVTAPIFCKATGQAESNLHNKRKIWTEGLVWIKLEGNGILYSISGYNKWVTQQAMAKCPQAFKLEVEKCASTTSGKVNGSGSRSRSKRTQKVSSKLAELEVI